MLHGWDFPVSFCIGKFKTHSDCIKNTKATFDGQFFLLWILLPGGWGAWRRRGWRNKGIRWLPHKAHEWRLWRRKLLRHQRLRASCWRRRLDKLTLWLVRLILNSHATWLATAARVVASTVAVVLVLIWTRAVAVSVIPTSVPVGGRGGRAVSIAAVAAEPTAAVFAASATTRAHASITFLLVHQVGVVGVAATVAHSATYNKRQMWNQCAVTCRSLLPQTCAQVFITTSQWWIWIH